ncbi:MAG: AAA family ATPase [Tetragenococcus halophilus]|nr:AAA family ATPase [Tetragenococcus halophilus]
MGIKDRVKKNKISTKLSDMKITIAGRPKSGKALDVNTKIPTPSGWKFAKDIEVGDEIFDRLGKPTIVLGVYPQGELEAYEVVMQDGTSFVANDEHIIPYVTSKKNINNKTLKEMMVDYKKPKTKFEHDTHTHKYRIPKNNAVEYEEKNLVIEPYALGVLIGDGCLLEGKLSISSNELDVLEKASKSLGLSMPYKNSQKNYTWNYETNEQTKKIKDELKFLGLNVKSVEKHIPYKYLISSIEQRKELLAGLMDTDGTVSINRDTGSMRYQFSTSSKQLKDDFKELALSLGYGVTVSVDNRHLKEGSNANFANYSLSVYTDEVIVSSEKHLKKLEGYEVRSFKDHYTYITDIVEVEPREMVCFKVDNEEELFLINDYIVTHNTSLFYEILKREGGLDTGLLFAFEKGYNFLDGINVVDIASWSDFIDAIDELEDDNEGFIYVGIDTVDIAGRLCQEYVLRKQSTKDGKRYDAMADIPFGKGYELVEAEFSRQFARLDRIFGGWMGITHDKDKTVKEKSGLEYDKTMMSANGRTGDYIKNSSDFIVFIDIQTEKTRDKETRKQTVKENRKIRFRGDGTTEAGGRIKEVPEEIDYDVDLFLKTIHDAVLANTGTGEESAEEKPKEKKVRKTVKADKPKEKEENVADIDSIKSKIGDFLSDLDLSEKKVWAKRFKEELGTMNFNESDDVKALQSILTDMEVK